MGRRVRSRCFLVIIPDYRIRLDYIRLHLQAHSDLLRVLFAFSHQNYTRYLNQYHVELTNLSITKPQAFSGLETFDLGASLSGNKFSTIPGDLVTEVTIKSQRSSYEKWVQYFE